MASALPDTLVKAFARARSRSLDAWEHARTDGDYSLFLGPFTQLLDLVRERGQALTTTGDGYDGLLDEHEPGLRRSELEPILRTLTTALVPLIDIAAERSRQYAGLLNGRMFPETGQRALVEVLLVRMGFDFKRGRLDRSSHPFTLAAGIDDVRLTLRFDPHNVQSALFAALHEGGHGLYDQGFGPDLSASLLADAPSIGLHESQSRLWENQVGRGAPFWSGFFPEAQRCLGAALDGLDAQRMYSAVNVVVPGVNRVGADELTYNLHIVLRTELELALLSGALAPQELPEVWREKSLRYLGVAPADDAQGCLQDVHWALGSFGYFPSYTIGNLYAAMLWAQLRRDTPDVDGALAAGDLAPVTSWLRRMVHVPGARETTGATIVRITGQPLSAASFLDYAQRKFGAPDSA